MKKDQNKRFLYISITLVLVIILITSLVVVQVQHHNKELYKQEQKRKEFKKKQDKNALFQKTSKYTYIIYRDVNNASLWYLHFSAKTPEKGYRLIPCITSSIVTRNGFYIVSDLLNRDIGLYYVNMQGEMVWFKKLYGSNIFNDTVLLEKKHKLYISGKYLSHSITLDTNTNHIVDFTNPNFKSFLSHNGGYLGLTGENLNYFDLNNNKLDSIELSLFYSKLPSNLRESETYYTTKIISLHDKGVLLLAGIKSTNRLYPWILKFNNSLQLEWQTVVQTNKDCSVTDGVETDEHNLMITGKGYNKKTGIVYSMVLKLDPNGKKLWTKIYSNGRYVTAKGIVKLPKEQFIVGFRVSNSKYSTSILMQIDKNGAIQRQQRFKYKLNEFGAPYDFFIRSMMSADNSLILSGSISPPGNNGFLKEGFFMKTDIYGDINTSLITTVPVKMIYEQ